MGALLLLFQLSRSTVMAGSLCTGDTVEPSPPACVRVQGRAACAMPGDLRVEADSIYIQWGDGNHSVQLTATGRAKVSRGKEVFSSDDARVVISEPETKARLTHVDFAFRPAGLGDPRCE